MAPSPLTLLPKLFLAIQNGKLEEAKALVKLDATQLKLRDDNGNTPLHVAAAYNRPKMVEYFVANGADVNAKNNYKAAPLFLAASEGRKEAVRKLLKLGANINSTNLYNCTALYKAAREGYMEVTRILLTAGADPAISNINNVSPYLIAKQRGHIAVAELIAKFEATSPEGATPKPKSKNGKNGHSHADLDFIEDPKKNLH